MRVLAWMVLSTMPIVSIRSSRNAWWVGLKLSKEASSSTAMTWRSKTTGSTIRLSGAAAPRPEAIST